MLSYTQLQLAYLLKLESSWLTETDHISIDNIVLIKLIEHAVLYTINFNTYSIHNIYLLTTQVDDLELNWDMKINSSLINATN